MFSRCSSAAMALITMTVAGGDLSAQSIWQSDRSAALTAENDAFGGSSDSSYTNGIRTRWAFMSWNRRLNQVANVVSLRGLLDRIPPEFASDRTCSLVGGRSDRPCGFVSFSIGQTMYTPSTLFDTMPRPTERPYAGMLFATLGMHKPGRRISASTELLLGVIGPWSGSEATQSLAHWTWSTTSEKPQGWRNQLRNRPQAGIINTYAFRPPDHIAGIPFPGEFCLKGCDGAYKDGRVFDLTATGELALGTHMRRASAGYIARLGIGFPDVPGVDLIPTTGIDPSAVARTVWSWIEKYQPWFFIFYRQEGRHVWYNAFLEGTPADVGGGGWRDINGITPRRNLGETTRGLSVGVAALIVTYQKVLRSTEYTTDGGRHTYGSFTVSLSTTGSATR